MTDTSTKKPEQNLNIYFLMTTAVLCGGLIMVVEILGSRIIGPYYGVSLFVWTSMITVTLLALSFGYYIGGVLSDRAKTADMLYHLILAAGVLVIAIPVIKIPVLTLCQPLGLRAGSLIASALLFGPPLALLGCVSPFVIKLSTKEMSRIGRNVGMFYAISTFGSCAGTILTGFVLIAYFRVSNIMQFVGVFLVLLSLVYYLFFRKKWIMLLSLLSLLLLFHSGSLISTLLPNGTRATQIYAKDSHYGNLQVVDYTYENKHTRELMIDGLIQGGIDMNSGLSVYPYSYFLQFMPYSYQPDGESCLVVGLGAGLVPKWFSSIGVKTDVVDIDPEVVNIARRYFLFQTSGDIVTEDARYFLLNSQKKYDYIILDVFSGDTTPSHLLTVEALDQVHAGLAVDGIVAMNLIGSLSYQSNMTLSAIKTINQVFDNVEVYPLYDYTKRDSFGNMIVIAYDGARKVPDLTMVNRFPIHSIPKSDVLRHYGKIFAPDDQEGFILTDDYNPYDVNDLWLKEKLRKSIIDSIPLKLLAI